MKLAVLRISCVECLNTTKAPLGSHGEIDAGRLVREQGWVISLLTAPGVTPVEMGPLCDACAKKIYPPELLNVARSFDALDASSFLRKEKRGAS